MVIKLVGNLGSRSNTLCYGRGGRGGARARGGGGSQAGSRPGPRPPPSPVSFAGREGLISRDEITAYFMRASSIYSKLGLGFPHNFQETTYLKPTFCDNCAGFVSCRRASGLDLGRGTRQVQ